MDQSEGALSSVSVLIKLIQDLIELLLQVKAAPFHMCFDAK